MKTLIAYYSRTGNTKQVAETLAEKLDADIDEIKDMKDRSGIVGWLMGGKDAFRENTTEIAFKKDPKDYDLVVIGTPVWAGTMTPAVRMYLKNNFKKVAFFCTYGGSEGKTFAEMQKISKKPVATLGLNQRELNATDEFCKRLDPKKS